ncbi:neural cell adhesion molecule 1-like [Hyla sarda]|uniref:neural cell adhesion molecule 1-like n=1 Tax=Hyla sarda TaxID=327740 RepID=UPI0024C4551B|nr:neural cell adhesion molecule 1-like [Hyla sarda]
MHIHHKDHKTPPPGFSILLLLFLSPTVFCSKPGLEIIPPNGEIYLGEEKNFLCKSTVEATIKWLDSAGDEIEDEDNRYRQKHIDESIRSVYVTANKAEPERTIQCHAESESGETATVELKLRVIQKPTFVKDVATRKEFSADSTAKLPCNVEGIPRPQVTWYRYGMPITPLPGHLSASPDGVLTIEKIQLSDAGMYYCTAYIREREEKAYKNVSVIVNAAPIVHFNTTNPNITSKSNTSFTCFVSGHPEPRITWKKGDAEVPLDGQKYVLSTDGLELSITELEKSDEGEYTCHAVNSYGEHNTTLILQVLDAPRGVGAGMIAGIFLLLLLVTLLAVDLTCYRTRRRGFLMYIATNVLGRPAPRVVLEDTDIKKESVVNISGIDA